MFRHPNQPPTTFPALLSPQHWLTSHIKSKDRISLELCIFNCHRAFCIYTNTYRSTSRRYTNMQQPANKQAWLTLPASQNRYLILSIRRHPLHSSPRQTPPLLCLNRATCCRTNVLLSRVVPRCLGTCTGFYLTRRMLKVKSRQREEQPVLLHLQQLENSGPRIETWVNRWG